ncbi:hypothetical protein INT43_008532 [Umbelopsis isabellina]|uniref:Damage-inducible protein DinB n=1 Tax=Mortierella isabellina TaxID=91625 RepID=A0A8H7UGM5_MORIS|nr:hypothetical protein INT43_008532 [Umbelopsis isabellina]
MVNSVPITTLLSLAHYNKWAYQRLLNGLSTVSDEDYYGNAGLVFRSLHGTLCHLYVADRNWHARFVNDYPDNYKESQLLWRGDDCYATPSATSSPWESAAQCWIDWLTKFPENTDLPKLNFLTSSGEQRKDQDSGLLMLHVFNHATHHRGQITAGVTHFGYPPIDGLDYYVYLTEQK